MSLVDTRGGQENLFVHVHAPPLFCQQSARTLQRYTMSPCRAEPRTLALGLAWRAQGANGAGSQRVCARGERRDTNAGRGKRADPAVPQRDTPGLDVYVIAESVQQGEDSREVALLPESPLPDQSSTLLLVRRGLAHDAKVRKASAGLLVLDRLSKGRAEQA